jgi:hypothetical protein
VTDLPADDERWEIDHAFFPGLDRTLAQAASEAPFPVFALPATPDGWDLSVSLFRPEQHPARPCCVHVDYRTPDGQATVAISQVPTGKSDFAVLLEDGPEFAEIERDGLSMLVRGRDAEWPETQVHLTRGRTVLTLLSRALSGPEVVELAARLRPA